jgi:protein Mpv17
MPDERNDCITHSVRSWDDKKNDDNNCKDDTRIIQNTILLLAVVLSVVTPLVTSVEWDVMRGWSPSEVVQGLLQGNWDRYISVLTNYPIPTKAVTSATVYSIGDILAQRTEGRTIGDLDRLRVLRSLTAGLIGHGPLSHCWYNFSEGLFTDLLQWTAWWAFIPKVVLDQMFWGPIWNNTYIALLGLMKRDSIHTIWGDIQRTTVPLVLSGLKLWPLAHCVTYGLIPVENRLLWVDTVEILWVTILATQAAAGAVTTEDAVIVMPIEPNNDAATFVEKS